MMIDRYLLDTCALMYLAQDEPIAINAINALRDFESNPDRVFVSSFSAWEIAMLVSKGRMNTTKMPLIWFEDVVKRMSATVLQSTPRILVASSYLPQPLHGDPADRIIIATARDHDLTIITRDKAILAYGDAGHVKTLAC